MENVFLEDWVLTEVKEMFDQAKKKTAKIPLKLLRGTTELQCKKVVYVHCVEQSLLQYKTF